MSLMSIRLFTNWIKANTRRLFPPTSNTHQRSLYLQLSSEGNTARNASGVLKVLPFSTRNILINASRSLGYFLAASRNRRFEIMRINYLSINGSLWLTFGHLMLKFFVFTICQLWRYHCLQTVSRKMREIEPAVSEAFFREEPLDPARGGGQAALGQNTEMHLDKNRPERCPVQNFLHSV